jgi:hypothetical protein
MSCGCQCCRDLEVDSRLDKLESGLYYSQQYCTQESKVADLERRVEELEEQMEEALSRIERLESRHLYDSSSTTTTDEEEVEEKKDN